MVEGKKTEMLFLSEDDMIKAGILDANLCVDTLVEMFKLLWTGDYRMGGPSANSHGIAVRFPKESKFPNMPVDGPDRRFMAMPAYLGGNFYTIGQKWYGSNVANPSRGLPRSVLMVLLNDPDTCEPIALMSANLLSAMRTGCVPGVATRYLAKKGASTLAVIGCGPINSACTMGIASQMPELKKVYLYDVFKENAEKFIKRAAEDIPGNTYEFVICESTEEAVKAADVISVAASRLYPVVIEDAWIQPGSLVLLTGNSAIDHSYWRSARVVLDNPRMHMDYVEEAHASGDVAEAYKNMMGFRMYECIDDGSIKWEDCDALGAICNGDAPAREDEEQRIVLLTGGIPLEDVAMGITMYRRAKEMGLGVSLPVWGEGHGAHWF